MKLTPEQMEAARGASGFRRTAIEAGAGSGKTAVLATRVRAAAREGSGVLACTFTVAAAEELTSRVVIDARAGNGLALDEREREGLTVGTLHSWCYDQLRTFPHAVGLTGDFDVYDEVDASALLSAAAEDLGRAARKSQSVEQLYEQRLIEGNATDYDGLLRHVTSILTGERGTDRIRQQIRSTARKLFVDEAQDLSIDQHELIEAIGAEETTLVYDPRQCQPPGTRVQVPVPKGAPPREVVIEALANGDHVAPWRQRGRHVFPSVGRAIRVATRIYDGPMAEIRAGGRTTRSTPDHRWTVRWDPENVDDLVCVYLMRRAGSYRVGWCKVIDQSGGFSARHYGLRARLEKADAFWILRTFRDRAAASFYESEVAVRFGIPTLMFHQSSATGLYRQDRLDDFWQRLGPISAAGAQRCFAAHPHLSADRPLWTNGTREGRATVFDTFAGNICDGMMLPVARGTTYDWHPAAIAWSDYFGPVHSMEVQGEHAYIADGICTLNCIYQWRKARPDLTDAWALDARRLTLTENHRSTEPIIAHANAIFPDRVAMKWPNPLIPGVTISYCSKPVHDVDQHTVPADSAATEAVLQIKRLLTAGYKPGEIAVLGRAWRDLEAVRDAFTRSDPEDIRNKAVCNVDQRHGYTMEYAPDPAFHRLEYTEEEDRLRQDAGDIPFTFCGPRTSRWSTEDGQLLARWLRLQLNPCDSNLTLLVLRSLYEPSRLHGMMQNRPAGVPLLKWARACGMLAPALPVRGVPTRAHAEQLKGFDWDSPLRYAQWEKIRGPLLDSLDEPRRRTLASFRAWWTFGRNAQSRTAEADRESVTLTSIHGAKGLAWKAVIVIEAQKLTNSAPNSENRNLLYVACTRARERLILLSSSGQRSPEEDIPFA